MKYKLFLLLFALLMPLTATAAGLGPSERISARDVLRGRFVQEHHSKGMAKPLRSEGSFVLSPDKGLIWAIEKPLPMTFVVSSDGMLQTVGGLPLLRMPVDKMPYLPRITHLVRASLLGDWDALEPDFAISDSGNAKRWRVQLAPKANAGAALPFQSITASGGRFVDRADVMRNDGLPESFAFTQQTVSAAPLTPAESAAFAAVAKP